MATTIQELKTDIQSAITLLNRAKKDFSTIIRDKSIPLDERWALFKEVPKELKNHSQFIYDIKIKGLPSRFDFWQEYEVDRHAVVDLIDVVEMVECDIECHKNGEELEFCFTEKLVTVPDIITQMKEDLLLSNTASFTYDW